MFWRRTGNDRSENKSKYRSVRTGLASILDYSADYFRIRPARRELSGFWEDFDPDSGLEKGAPTSARRCAGNRAPIIGFGGKVDQRIRGVRADLLVLTWRSSGTPKVRRRHKANSRPELSAAVLAAFLRARSLPQIIPKSRTPARARPSERYGRPV